MGVVLYSKNRAFSAINAKEIKVVFNNKVDETTATDKTHYTIGAFTNTNFVVELQENGKTVIVTLGANDALTSTNANYLVKVTDDVLDASGEALPEDYEALVSMSDKTRPTMSLSYPVNGIARVTFSELMNVANNAAVTITDSEGAVVSNASILTYDADDKYFDIDTSGFADDENHTVSMVGIADYAGNLITPNPSALTIVKKDVDTKAPTVTAVEALDVNKIKVTFSEKVGTLGTVNTEAVTASNSTVDSTGLVYTITTTSSDSPELEGITPVTIAGFKDLSGNAMTDPYVKTLNFVTDETNPKFVSSEAKQVGAEQYLYLKYDENVKVNSTTSDTDLTGTYVDADSINLWLI